MTVAASRPPRKFGDLRKSVLFPPNNHLGPSWALETHDAVLAVRSRKGASATLWSCGPVVGAVGAVVVRTLLFFAI
jgi:hypothetical protein